MNNKPLDRMNKMPMRAKQLALAGATALLAGSIAALVAGCSIQETPVEGSNPLLSGMKADARLQEEDFRFPSRAPSLARGHEVFKSTCAECHSQAFFQQGDVQENLAKTTPIDLYLFLTTGKKPEIVNPMGSEYRNSDLPEFHGEDAAQGERLSDAVSKVSHDDRWAVLLQHVRERCPAAKIAIIGMPHDQASGEWLARSARGRFMMIGLDDAMAMVATSDVLISPDTAITHVASAFQRPTLTLLRKDFDKLVPYRTPGRNVYSDHELHVRDLPTDRAIRAFDDLADELALGNDRR